MLMQSQIVCRVGDKTVKCKVLEKLLVVGWEETEGAACAKG